MGGHSNHATNTNTTSNKDQTNEATDVRAEETSRWIKNLSNIPLTKSQERLLGLWTKVCNQPKPPPTREYIVAIE